MEDAPPAKELPNEKEPDPEPAPEAVPGGRRRGRRKVVKKTTVKDDEGYLVSKEETVWESYSEDEPVVRKKPTLSSSGSQKVTKSTGKGNIMSFFAKK